MANQQDDLVAILTKLIQSNPVVGLGAAALIALWWIGKNDKSDKKTNIEDLSEEELVIALAKVRAKKLSGNETGKVLNELKKIIDALEKEKGNES